VQLSACILLSLLFAPVLVAGPLSIAIVDASGQAAVRDAGNLTIIANRDEAMTVTRSRKGALHDAELNWVGPDRLRVADCSAGDLFLLATRTRVGSFVVDQCGQAMAAAMYDRAALQLGFERAVTHGVVTSRSCDQGILRMQIPFAAEKGQALVPFPAGCSQVSIAAEGLRRIDAGTVTVRAGQTHALTVPNPGNAASLLVRVRDAQRLPAAGVLIAAVRADELRDVRSLQSLARVRPIDEVTSDTNGWSVFRHLGDGAIQLLARREDGTVVALSPVLRLSPGDERIEQLELDRPGSLRIQIDRDADSAADVELRGVTLEPGAGSRWPPLLELRAAVGSDSAVFEAVPPGTWTARAEARVRGGTLQSIGRTEVLVQPGLPATATLSLAGLRYSGKVTGGRTAINNGLLYLQRADGGIKGNQSALIDGGRFAVLLEEPGTFRVSIQRRDGSRIDASAPVRFESPSHEVTVRLGEAQIAGVVATADGAPVGNTRVYAQHTENVTSATTQTSTDAEGRFVFADLAPGRWSLRATDDRRQSDDVMVDVAPGQERGGIRLVVQQVHFLRGRVVHANGAPAAHAGILVRDASLGNDSIIATAGATGEFELRHTTPLDGKNANVFVRITDGAFAKRATLKNDMVLVAPGRGIVLLRRDGPWHASTMADHMLVDENGAWVHPLSVGRIENDLLRLALAPGVWRYVVISTPAQRQLLRSGAGLALPSAGMFTVQESITSEAKVALGDTGKERK